MSFVFWDNAKQELVSQSLNFKANNVIIKILKNVFMENVKDCIYNSLLEIHRFLKRYVI